MGFLFESVLKEAGDILRIDNRIDVQPKGADLPIVLYEIGGIGEQSRFYGGRPMVMLKPNKDYPERRTSARKELTPPEVGILSLDGKNLIPGSADTLPDRTLFVDLLNSIAVQRISAGERFITQGSPGDRCYVIQQGTCVVSVEKNGELTPVARLREGDIVGEMAILTGESRSAHVDAESDMKLWELTKEQFDSIAGEFPELRTFLTELLANWFETRTITANRKIGKYLLTDIIGTGGYSFVYRGLHEALDRPVAIKMMKHDMAMEPDFLKKFRDEARTIANFNHQNIVHVYDIEERFRTVFIIMEYLKGMSLRKLLQNMIRLPSQQVVDYLLQTCTGFARLIRLRLAEVGILLL